MTGRWLLMALAAALLACGGGSAPPTGDLGGGGEQDRGRTELGGEDLPPQPDGGGGDDLVADRGGGEPDVVEPAELVPADGDEPLEEVVELPDGQADADLPDGEEGELWGPDGEETAELEEEYVVPPPSAAFSVVENVADGILKGDFPKLVTAEQLQAKMKSQPGYYHVVDVRGAALYGAGHIAGSVSVPLADLGEHWMKGSLPLKQPIVLVCNAGQQSGWASGLLNLAGYDAWSLEWGLPAWNTEAGNMWAGSVGNAGTGVKTTAVPPEPKEQAAPELPGDPEFPAALITQQVKMVFDGAFKFRDYSQIAGQLGAYFIIHYGSLAEYEQGHLPGAHHFGPGDFDDEVKLLLLPPDKQILVYCCSGQSSAFVASVLNALGYQAWTLRFGMNAMWHDELTACKWDEALSAGYPLQ